MAIEVDNLFEALDIILDQRLKEISYDKTEICIITDDSNAKNGRYWVSPNNGVSRYEAYSESDEYKKGESVRVSILNGDFTQKKFITGKYVVDDAITPMTYVSPLNTVIDVTGNVIDETKFNHQYSLSTNGTRREIPIWSADLDLDESYKDLQASGIYNTIALSAQFRTLLDNYDMRTGSYGLRLDIYTKVNPASDKYIVRSVSLDSSEMFGNPYGFIIYGTQAKKFDLSQIGIVEKMVLTFYQSGDFSYYDNSSHKTIVINPEEVYQDNILMRNVKIYFGSDVSIIADNTIQAFTQNKTDYRLIVTEADNEKNLSFLWYNKDSDNQYLGFSDGVVEFELDDKGQPIQIHKLNKKWENATEDVKDKNGRVVQTFIREEDGSIALVFMRDADGKPISISNINDAKARLEEELTRLEAELTDLYLNEIIEDSEYNDRSADIRDYYNAKLNYLNTPHYDQDKEDAAYARQQASYAEAETAFNRNEITDLQLRDLKRAADRVYEQEIAEIRNTRFEMTYVLRGKQRDVFTNKIKVYDEIEYLIESEIDNRLVAQTGRENIASDYKSLKLAADFAEAKPLITKTIDLVTKDLYGVLRQMQQRTQSVAEIATLLNTVLITPKASADGFLEPGDTANISAWYESVDKKRIYLNNVYSQFLAYNYRNQIWHNTLPAERDPQGGITYLTSEEQLQDWVGNKINLWESIRDEFNIKLIPMLDTLFTTIEDIIRNPKDQDGTRVNYSGYQGIYDTYYKNAKRVAITIKENLDKLELLLNGDPNAEEPIASNYDMMSLMPPCIGNEYSYVDYTKKDFSDSDNKYAIYWYRYEPGYKSDDRLIGAEWKRMLTKDDFGIEAGSTEPVYNFGLPIYDDFELRDGKYYFSSKALNTNTTAVRMMDGKRKEERYKVILFYNHEMFESNEIVFTNIDGVPDETTVDQSDAIVITHGENSQDTYQSYGLTNYLVNAADASKVRTISVHYEGLFAKDEALAGTQVYWYIPNSGTMLTCDDKHLTEVLGFFSDREIEDAQKPDYSKSGYTCYYKPIRSKTVTVEDDPETDDINEEGEHVTADPSDLTFTYKIKDYYLATSSRNDIICKIVKDEYTFETEIVFAFTSLGTSGTDYTLAVTPATTKVAVDVSAPLPLNITLYDYNNKEIPISNTLLSAENGATDFKLDWEGPTSYLAVETTGANGINGADVTLKTLPGENDSLIYGVMKLTANCPIKYTTTVDDEGEDVFGDAAEDKETGTKQSTRNVDLTSYYPVPYSAGDYYIEGATTIVYDSMGSNPSYYKDPYNIFYCNTNENIAEIKKDESEELRYDVRWRMVYYKKGKNGEVVKLDKATHSDYNMCRNYMPTLNEKNGINPSAMYLGDMDCWCAVECWYKDLAESKLSQKYTLLWVQPILIIQNRYASPMLNAWDGSLTIDKKNGTILSSMVGAGRKTRQNTFEGVLMGDIEGSAGIYDAKNKSGLGLYGFNDGAQSFGFNVDGTGFIGKSGRGRIMFDGNEGTIESASYTTGVKPYGMKIDFDDGWIDMKGGVEFEEADWVNYIIEKYNEVLDAQNRIYNQTTGLLEVNPDQPYVIDTEVMSVEMQQALKEKIEYDSQHMNIMYQEAIDALYAAKSDPDLPVDEYEALDAEYKLMQAKSQLVDNEYKYYALTTLKTAQLLGEFSIEDVTYKFTLAQYNTLMNELDNAILMETYAGTAIGEEDNYKSRYGELSRALQEEVVVDNETYQVQSHVHLDVKSPYFYIISEQGKRILNIGDQTEFDFEDYPYTVDPEGNVIFNGTGTAKKKWLEPYGDNLSKGYYLKSNDFSYSHFNKEDGEASEQGSGFLLDLTNGNINAFNLKITSKNIFIDSSAGADPFLIVKDNDGCNLFYAGQEDFYMQSHTYSRYVLGDRFWDNMGKEYFYPGFRFKTYSEKNEDDEIDYNFLFDIRGNYQSVFKVTKDEYYLQTDNYKPRQYFYVETDGDNKDTKIGRAEKGQIIYSTPEHSLSAQTEKLTGDEHYDSLVLSDEKEVDGLMWYKIGSNQWLPEYSLKTVLDNYGTGINIDLQHGHIDAYDFIIRGESSGGNTQGSYLLLDSQTPQFVAHLQSWGSDGFADLDLIKISPTEFFLHSANWREETITFEDNTKTAIMNGGYNIRSGPGTNNTIVGSSSEGKKVSIWAESTGEGSSKWYCIGDGQWIAAGGLRNFADGAGEIDKSTGSGMSIDMERGTVSLYNSNNINKKLIIDADNIDYPFQIGDVDDYNLQFGWDGSMKGGTTYVWSIGKDGTAQFNRLNANGGSLNWMYIGSATMTSTSVTDSFTFGGESFAPADFSINFAQWGYYNNESSEVILTGSTKVTISGSTAEAGGWTSGQGGEDNHTHWIPGHSHGAGTLKATVSDEATLYLYNKQLTGRVLATGDITLESGVT